MSLFDFTNTTAIGSVYSVDTASVIVKVADFDNLRKLQVNHLVCLRSAKAGQHLIGLITKITRKMIDDSVEEVSLSADENTENLIKVSLIGTMIDKLGTKSNIFRRTLESVPEIEAACFVLEGEVLTSFMKAIAQVQGDKVNLSLGKYTLDENAEAYLDGNRLFQRHAVIVGSTGSGKSWTVARLLEQAATLPNVNAIVFDLHGEYSTITGTGFQHLRVSGPNDAGVEDPLTKGIIYLPYWMLTYEEIISLLLDRSDQNAPNQAMVFSRTILQQKSQYLQSIGKTDVLDTFTIDSPVPYNIEAAITELIRLNTEMVQGSRAEKAGDYKDKLSRFIQRLEAKRRDRRLTFLFGQVVDIKSYGYLNEFCHKLMAGSKDNAEGGIKIIDFSDVPSDILPLIIGLVARLVFSVQQWCKKSNRHPISLFCDEAHLYIPERLSDSSLLEMGYRSFERIAKEGRKYGVSLTIISQRPSEVNRTVLSQCNNFIAMKLSNADDQSVIKRLLPDNLGGVTDILPILDIGEALIVGDASLLPSRVRIDKPNCQPSSATVAFWDEWLKDNITYSISDAVEAMRKQTHS
ncbi:MAG: ATP-binding protein [Ignavibacteria bacterium]|nr:ATP-binding protein [Ignavibacteria bacterium]